jgi:predicted transcriptional regulator
MSGQGEINRNFSTFSMTRRDRSSKNTRHLQNIQVPVYSEEPSVSQGGQFYWNSNTKVMNYSNGNTWVEISELGNVELINIGDGCELVIGNQIKSLVAGSNIFINCTSNEVIISADVSGVISSLADAGAGNFGLTADGTGPDLTVKTISNGANLSITESANVLTFDVTLPMQIVTTLADAGAGNFGLTADGTGPDLSVKTISNGANLSITESANVLTFDVTLPMQTVTTLADAGAGNFGLTADGTGPDLSVKTISNGANLSITESANVLTFDVTLPMQTVTTLADSGAGTFGLTADGTGPDLTVKTISNGANLSITESANVLTFDVTLSSVTTTTLTSAGGGSTLVNDGTGPSLAIKSLTAGTGVIFDSDSTNITISSNAATVKASNTVAQSIPNFTITPLNLNTTDWNIGGFTVGATTITVPKTARYNITVNYAWDLGTVTGGIRILFIRVNGGSVYADNAIFDAISGISVPLLSTTKLHRSYTNSLSLTAGDAVDVAGLQDTGAALTIGGAVSSFATQLIITEIL